MKIAALILLTSTLGIATAASAMEDPALKDASQAAGGMAGKGAAELKASRERAAKIDALKARIDGDLAVATSYQITSSAWLIESAAGLRQCVAILNSGAACGNYYAEAASKDFPRVSADAVTFAADKGELTGLGRYLRFAKLDEDTIADISDEVGAIERSLKPAVAEIDSLNKKK